MLSEQGALDAVLPAVVADDDASVLDVLHVDRCAADGDGLDACLADRTDVREQTPWVGVLVFFNEVVRNIEDDA